MSFLKQLKSQASALQSQYGLEQCQLDENTARTEVACGLVAKLLVSQLNSYF